MPTIETAERLLSVFEDIMVDLPAGPRAQLAVELDRLQRLAGAADVHTAAAEHPRMTGVNRASLDDDD
jgi:hypothetical protein